ncbi:Transmembrane emp24 domain-containing protein p24beta2 [Striga hermonthica]|uniref:Transmembrane emp24 domain-containing protein p24beta2 n=1 Tax=Striga hermonthica TaxID=68872 RepID=A0A9N7MUF2_STRHE|nr:Transmembrane emp24 domain-containing protein p24beta2 [Striga hermonthica]
MSQINYASATAGGGYKPSTQHNTGKNPVSPLVKTVEYLLENLAGDRPLKLIIKMKLALLVVAVLVILYSFKGAFGIRFVIDREECFSHKVDYGHTVHFSFVVIKSEGSWHYSEDGVDLVVKGPNGEQVHDVRDQSSHKHEFVSYHQGVYRFCFTNKSPYHETIDFDVHAGHFLYHDEHAKDEHFKPLFEHIGKLEEALYNIQFEQHWLEAQTDRQAIVNEKMSRGALHKVLFESLALVAVSGLQVYILRRLFEKKLGASRV